MARMSARDLSPTLARSSGDLYTIIQAIIGNVQLHAR